jgi:predicted membrane GTPase involved in stress response
MCLSTQGTNHQVGRLSVNFVSLGNMRTSSHIKLARNRVDISNNELARHWCKHFGATRDKIEAAVAKVGDNPETVQKELRAQGRCNP